MRGALYGSLLAICGLFAAGCGGEKSATVHGTVLLDGQPLAGAEVQFVPKTDSTLGSHTVTTGPDGKFTLQAAASNTPVRPGSYVVVVNKWVAGDPSKGGGGMEGTKNDVPPAYRAQATTTLKAEIAEGEVNLEPFYLLSKGMQQGGDPNKTMQMK
ncbi:MAG TPA: carboxypeptidase-like regulatory domain-containing protein [Gemmata sp.]